MPLCNIPLIEYTLEVLAISDVRDVFVVCTSHIEKIKAYFEYVVQKTAQLDEKCAILTLFYLDNLPG